MKIENVTKNFDEITCGISVTEEDLKNLKYAMEVYGADKVYSLVGEELIEKLLAV